MRIICTRCRFLSSHPIVTYQWYQMLAKKKDISMISWASIRINCDGPQSSWKSVKEDFNIINDLFLWRWANHLILLVIFITCISQSCSVVLIFMCGRWHTRWQRWYNLLCQKIVNRKINWSKHQYGIYLSWCLLIPLPWFLHCFVILSISWSVRINSSAVKHSFWSSTAL